MNEMILIGKTVSTFGIKGELKVISDFERMDLAYVLDKKILINNIEHVITGVRYHKNYVLLEIDGLNNINDVLEFVGFNIYIKRDDLGLKSDEFLINDLLNKEVIDDGEVLGVVEDILKGPRYDYLKVNSILIPIVSEYFIRYDKQKGIVYTKKAKDLIL